MTVTFTIKKRGSKREGKDKYYSHDFLWDLITHGSIQRKRRQVFMISMNHYKFMKLNKFYRDFKIYFYYKHFT